MAYESKDTLVERFFTQPSTKATDMFNYETRKAEIRNLETDDIIFSKDNVTFPEGWSQNAVNIVTSKYFAREGVPETGEEKDIRQMVGRYTTSLRNFGESNGYFQNPEEAETFQEELSYLVLNQMYSPNSPTWFNVGKGDIYGIGGSSENGLFYFNEKTGKVELTGSDYEKPQCSACFILGLEDKLFGQNGIIDWWDTETRLFKFGSGSGVTLQYLRAIGESLSGGGESSGALSFARVSDIIADVVKSGGITRRAAKMVNQHINHPEVIPFIDWKVESEKQVRALVASGLYTPQAAYAHVSGQNSNNSVVVHDQFMEAAKNGGNVDFIEVKSGEIRESIPAKELLIHMAAATHISGDPGIQYDHHINAMNTVKNSGKINVSNPCSEYFFIDDSACNLGSNNVKKFTSKDGKFDVKAYEHALRIETLAQEMVVDLSGYPSAPIAKNSHLFRPIGIGHANIGATLMSQGIPYDNDYGREFAAAITAKMTATVYDQSARIAARKGPFKEFGKNKEPFMEVMDLHLEAAERLKPRVNGNMNLEELVKDAKLSWHNARELLEEHGARNAQATLLAPTGTIGFMMDCDTTGIEPSPWLVMYKKLVGGGTQQIINQSIPEGLRKLGYSEDKIKDIEKYVLETNMVEGAPHMKDEHLAVFDTANRSAGGTRFLTYMAHLKMMAATQPFLSGAISKTVNLPFEAKIEDILDIYEQGHELGLKAIAVYRDDSKLYQPLVDEDNSSEEELPRGTKISLDERREGLVKVTSINNPLAGLEYRVHLLTGEYPNGDLGEIRIQISKQGSHLRKIYDDLGIALSEGLKTGVKLESFAEKYINSVSEVSGATSDPSIRSCSSMEDWIFRTLILEYSGTEKYKELTGDTNFSLTPQQERELRVNRNTEAKRSQVYFDDIANINRKMALKTMDEVRAYDEEREAKLKKEKEEEEKSKKGSKKIKRKTTTGGACDICGSQLIPDGKCKKCVNCGKTVGGCAM
jgi:ribonucleoside-diphosphate reductase alpha chain